MLEETTEGVEDQNCRASQCERVVGRMGLRMTRRHPGGDLAAENGMTQSRLVMHAGGS
jgi:hypothetical protein